jgi:hypothetical protein
VVATIDGDEIRLDDVELEIPSLHAWEGADKNLVNRRALQEIVDRRLLIRSLGDPSMRVNGALPAPERRKQELGFLLTCFKRRAASVPPPPVAQINDYVVRHPNAFADRRIYRVDQLVLHATLADVPRLRVIEEDHTLEAVIAHLNGLGIAFDRTRALLDTADVSLERAKEIDALPPGEPFLMRKGGFEMVYVVMGREPIDETLPEARRRAVFAAAKERDFALFDALTEKERARAKITYASGFEPPPPSSLKPPA